MYTKYKTHIHTQIIPQPLGPAKIILLDTGKRISITITLWRATLRHGIDFLIFPVAIFIES